MPFGFTMAAIALASSAVSAGAQIHQAGQQRRAMTQQFIYDSKVAQFNAANIETQRVFNQATAIQRATERHAQFKFAESANRALLSGSMGRDMGDDRSVAAFLRRNREEAFKDVSRIEDQRKMDSLNAQLEAASVAAGVQRPGPDPMPSAIVGAFTTMAGALDTYDRTRFSPVTQRQSGAVMTSPRPQPRPR